MQYPGCWEISHGCKPYQVRVNVQDPRFENKTVRGTKTRLASEYASKQSNRLGMPVFISFQDENAGASIAKH